MLGMKITFSVVHCFYTGVKWNSEKEWPPFRDAILFIVTGKLWLAPVTNIFRLDFKLQMGFYPVAVSL
jgi:hypothetical protein